MATLPHERMSPEEYLRLERSAETKSEYDDGVMYALPGGSRAHSLIAGNTGWSLRNHLPSRCAAYTSDMKVRSLQPTRFLYPDVSVVCGDSLFADNDTDVLLNPLIIFEVLSNSTERYDRGLKFRSYQSIESLREYVLIAQDAYLVEHFRRDGTQWVYSKVEGRDANLHLASVNIDLPLSEIYYQVDLTPGATIES